MPKKFDFLSPGIKITEVDQSVLPAETEEDGPIIIGRTRKGPGMQPVKIKSLEDFVKVFGTPAPGGSSVTGDLWRDGPNISAPTYGAYAAQSWLASENSPITMVRLLGDESSTAADGSTGKAGWQLTNSSTSPTIADNSTAYGLFIIESGSVGQGSFREFKAASNTKGDYEGDTFTITRQGGTTYTFEFVADGGAVGNAANVTVDISSQSTRQGIASVVVAAIQTKIDDGSLTNLSVKLMGTADADGTIRVLNYSTTTTVALASSDTSRLGLEAGDDTDFTDASATIAVAPKATGTGALAAVLYCDSGYMTLSGCVANDNGLGIATSNTASAATLVESIADNCGFGINIFNSSGTQVGGTLKFDFSRNSAKYIRKVLNTTPQLTSTTMTAAGNRTTYWLGESYERHLRSLVTGSLTGRQYGILLPLQKADNSAATGNWGYHRAKHKHASTGFVIADDTGNDNANYDALNATKLFKFECLHSGDELQKEIGIAISEIKLAPNPQSYAYGSFTVTVLDLYNGQQLETFSNCNLDPNSANFVARKIGDQKLVWDDVNKKFNVNFDNPNVSDYIRVEMFDENASNYKASAIPFGFLGPGRPKSFLLTSGSTSALNTSFQSFTGHFVEGSGSVPATVYVDDDNGASGTFFSSSIEDIAMKFEFPKLQLRLSGTDGFVANPYKALFGIRPKTGTSTNNHDYDYCDYVRALPSNYDGNTLTPTGDFEHSFAFTLDDIVIRDGLNHVYHMSGSRKDGTSYTAVSGTAALLDKKVKQFLMPMFGGRHGLDIKEYEPFRNDKIAGLGTTDATNYLRYSLGKALDSVADPEYIPANLLVMPGIIDNSTTNKLIGVAEDRQDVLAIIDIDGDYVSVYESTSDASTRRGSVDTAISTLKNRNIDSTFACAFYPAVQVLDKLNNNQRVWLPSSIAGLGGIAQSEAASAAWFAPAGFNRGGLGNLGGSAGPTVVQARQRLDSDDRDKMYSEANINPIATFPNEGVVIFGQKTLQTGVESALGRINVRRLLIYLKSRISDVARTILFDNNVSSTWARFKARAEPILSDVQSRFGLTEYRLVLDETTTTPDLIDKNILYAQVYLKPARAIEFIAIDFIVTRTGAQFA